uniref:C2H2-type domain-containing protein n=1 Tax=Anopheles maculatus TaxID=74869 RepID=A0A182SLA9_9DIPT
MVTIRVASEAQPQQQHQPPVLLTQLKQEPMTEEQCENNVIPDVVSSSPPPPPTPTTPLVEMKPSLATVAVKAVEPSSSANATVVMATSCTERTVAALASVMMVSNKRADDNVPAATVDDVPVLSVAEVPHVPNGCGSSIETAREKRNSKDDEIPCPITMNGTQQGGHEEEKMQEMASPSLPVNVAVNDVPEQTKVPVKRGRGRPPKTSHQKPAPTAKVVTELSAPEETTTNSCTTTVVEQHVGVVSDLGDSINVRVESQVGEVKRSSKKKGYISVGALFASAKTARKQQNVAKKQKVESVSVATKEESSTIAIAAEPVPERTATAEETVTAANTTAVTNAPNEQQVLAENKTEQAISTPAAACAAVNCEDDTEINGPSNLQEEITVQPTLPTGGKTTREESVASGDGGESSVSSLTEEGVVGSGAKQSADLISGAVPDTEKESSPASDSGIESVTETGTNNASKKSKERSRSCLLSLPSSSNLEDKSQPINDEPAVVVKQESEQQKLRVVSRRQTIATESVKRDSNDDEEKIVRKGKRTMRANRKLSAKAKEAAEATEAAEAAEAVVVEATDASESANNVSLSSRDELKCPKCKMQFKTDLWYRKHLLNHHDIQPEQSAQLLSEDGSSARIEDETMPSPASTTEETEPPVAVNGSANTDENCVENYLPTAETVIEAVTGDVSQNDTEPEQALIPDEAISPKIILPAAESKVSSGRKRKSTPYGGANASKEETTSSLDATMASNGSIATEELLLPVVTNVKVEYRTLSGAQSRDRAEEEADEAEGSDEFGSSPLPSVKNRSKSSRRKSSIVTPPVVETITKVEKQDPDDADKLTPFEAAKVTVIESELTGETHYTCTICGGQFTGKSSIKEHLSTSHAAIKRRSCEYCGRTFIQTGDLTRHTRIHTGYRPFKCPVVECSFAFISSGDLHKHVRRHNQQPLPKPHVCDQCGKDFERSYDLKRHKTMHAKSEPDFKGISCGVCGKVFARQDQFRAHTYRHIGYRPYQCEICGKAFTDPSNYSKHARLHEMDGVEVVCNFCGRPFKNKSAISKHIFHCQQKTSGAARKASGSKKRGGDTKKDGKKSRRVGMAVGYGKESGDDTTMVVNPKQENVTYDEQRPIVTKRELADSELEGGGSPSAGGRTKQQKQQQQASRKRKKRRQRTPSSTEEDDNDDDDGDDGDEDSGDDFIGPSSSCDPYGTATFAGGAVKRDRRSRKLSLSQYDADK